MTDATRIRFGRSLAAVSVVLTLAGTVIVAVLGRWDFLIGDFMAHSGVLAIGFSVLAWVVLSAQPRNGAVWALAWSAFFAGVYIAADAMGVLLARSSLPDLRWEVMKDLSMEDLPRTAAIAAWPATWGWIPAFFVMLTLGLLLFPDGRFLGPQWRWVGWFSAAAIVIVSSAQAWNFRPSSTLSTGASFEEYPGAAGAVVEYGFLLILLAALVSIVSLIVRFRRSSGETRRQILLIAGGGASLTVAFAVGGILDAAVADPGPLFDYLALVGVLLLMLAFVVAILKYRLYDLDVVISKTVTYVSLAAFIAAVYVGVVVGISGMIGGRSSFALSVAATVLVAMAFQPVRRWVELQANHLVYGRRATPYEVLARFSRRAAESTDEDLLARVPQMIVEGTSASSATLWVQSGDGFREAATWPHTENGRMLGSTKSEFTDAESDHAVSVHHGHELLGGISLIAARGESITEAEKKLVADLASAIGLAMRNTRLTSLLRAQLAELEASRERVLASADEARRALENDLDSGPQQQLVALKVKLGPTRKLAERAEAKKTAALLTQLENEAGNAIQAVRDFAGGIYPPLLEAEGLKIAIAQQARSAAIPVRIDADTIGRYPREVEAAVYFAVLEALQNTAKYAEASSASVKLDDDGDALRFEVRDDGRGFDATATARGAGLTGMADRLDTVGGGVTITSNPGEGTVVVGTVVV